MKLCTCLRKCYWCSFQPMHWLVQLWVPIEPRKFPPACIGIPTSNTCSHFCLSYLAIWIGWLENWYIFLPPNPNICQLWWDLINHQCWREVFIVGRQFSVGVYLLLEPNLVATGSSLFCVMGVWCSSRVSPFLFWNFKGQKNRSCGWCQAFLVSKSVGCWCNSAWHWKWFDHHQIFTNWPAKCMLTYWSSGLNFSPFGEGGKEKTRALWLGSAMIVEWWEV